MIENVHFNQRVTNVMIECAFGLSGLVEMDSAFRADITCKLTDILLNATVSASSITCAKRINTEFKIQK